MSNKPRKRTGRQAPLSALAKSRARAESADLGGGEERRQHYFSQPVENPTEREMLRATLEEIARKEYRLRRLEFERDQLVFRAREQGASWLQIARELGRPRQNVQRKYEGRAEGDLSPLGANRTQ